MFWVVGSFFFFLLMFSPEIQKYWFSQIPAVICCCHSQHQTITLMVIYTSCFVFRVYNSIWLKAKWCKAFMDIKECKRKEVWSIGQLVGKHCQKMISVSALSQRKLITWVASFLQAFGVFMWHSKGRSVNKTRTKIQFYWYPPDLCLQHVLIITLFVKRVHHEY